MVMGVVCVLLAALSIMEQVSVKRLTDDALAQTHEVMQSVRSGAFDEAIQKARALDQMWDARAVNLEVLVDHGSTDDVRYALSRLIAALESQDQATAMIYASELEGGIEHVYERQELSVQNVL